MVSDVSYIETLYTTFYTLNPNTHLYQTIVDQYQFSVATIKGKVISFIATIKGNKEIYTIHTLFL